MNKGQKDFTFPFHIFEGTDFQTKSQRVDLKKREIVAEQFLDYTNMAIVNTGLIILYWINEENEQTIIDFKSKGEVLRPAVEIYPEIAGNIYAEAITESEIVVVDRVFMCDCSSINTEVGSFFYSLLNDDISKIFKQLKLLKEANLEKRYEFFIKEFKHINNLISDRMIANYLGVHYTTLSRAKARVLNRK